MCTPLWIAAAIASLPVVTLAEGTPLRIELVDAVASQTAANGDVFAVRLAAPVRQEDCTLLPDGLPGTGQVIHASRHKGGGRAGELILTVRSLDANGVRVPVRGFRINAVGRQLTGSLAVGGVTSLETRQGEEVIVPAGTAAEGKVAVSVEITGTDCG